jgi:hypothetical protein
MNPEGQALASLIHAEIESGFCGLFPYMRSTASMPKTAKPFFKVLAVI